MWRTTQSAEDAHQPARNIEIRLGFIAFIRFIIDQNHSGTLTAKNKCVVQNLLHLAEELRDWGESYYYRCITREGLLYHSEC